jgi:hypothetical protein
LFSNHHQPTTTLATRGLDALVDMASENDDAIRRECFLALCTIMSCDFEEMVRYCGVLKHTNADEEGEEEAEVD